MGKSEDQVTAEAFANVESASFETVLGSAPGALIAAWLPGQEGGDVEYRFWHVETLLNQTADLLDRCLANKQLADEFWQAHARYKLDLLADSYAQTISDREVLEGADRFELADLRSVRQEIDNRQLNQLRPTGDIGPLTRAGIHENYMICAHVLGEGTAGKEGARAGIERNDQAMALMNFHSDVAQRNLRIKALEDEYERDKIKRANAKQLRDDRRTLGEPGKPFDFSAKIQALVDFQIKPDLEDALARARAAEEGLAKIYGWKPSARMPALPDPAQAGANYVERLHAWTQRAIGWLVQFSHLDQGWTKTYSLRALVGEARWIEGTARPFVFDISLEDFITYRAVRLRGISAIAVGAAGSDGLWTASFLPPSEAYILDEGAEFYSPRHLNQPWLPVCRIGRVETRHALRSPEIAGTVSLMNISPISAPGMGAGSSWQCAVESATIAGAPPAALDDLLIEFSLAARPVLGAGV